MTDQLINTLESTNTDAFFVLKKPNVRWVSGYTGDDSFLVVTKSARVFITDPRYTEQASKECADYEIVSWRDYGSVAAAVAAVAKRLKIKRIGFEQDAVSFGVYSAMKEAVKAELVPTENVIERLRAVKTPLEKSYLRAACDISCRAFERILKDIRVGVTEKELAAKLSGYMVLEGADTQPYGNILISGARTSLLHGIPSEKAVEYGDLVLMDFGCQYKGYLSDMTRTVVVGRASEKQREVYELEKGMTEDSLAVMKAGVSVGDVYAASAKRLENSPYKPYHYQGIGHGIGLFVHELPFIGPHHKGELILNSSTTIEPGIYIPDWGGVRIEDQVLINEDGNENLISTTHELIEL